MHACVLIEIPKPNDPEIYKLYFNSTTHSLTITIIYDVHTQIREQLHARTQ